MNKYLMLSAAALLAGTATAGAGTYCFNFGTANGGSYCDGGVLYTGVDSGIYHKAVRSWRHVNNNCAGASSNGMGILAKTKGLGDASAMSDNGFAQNYGIFSEQLIYTFPKKIKNGRPITIWIEFNGTSSFEANSGTLQGVTKCKAGDVPVGHGRTSTLAGVKALLVARRTQ
jgi:hypothetical protein